MRERHRQRGFAVVSASRDELALMYRNLKTAGVGDFRDGGTADNFTADNFTYWASSN